MMLGDEAVLKSATGLKLLRAAVPPVAPEKVSDVPVVELALFSNPVAPPAVPEVPVAGTLVKLGADEALKSPSEAVPSDPELPVVGVLVKSAVAA